MASPTDTVRIFDTTLRDGEQSPGIALSAPEKIEIARQLARLGVDVIEAGFAISSPGEREGIRAVSQAVACVVASLARTNTEDVDAAIESLQGARNPRAGLFRQITTTNNDPARRKEQYDGWTRTDEMAEAGDRLHVLEQNRRVA